MEPNYGRLTLSIAAGVFLGLAAFTLVAWCAAMLWLGAVFTHLRDVGTSSASPEQSDSGSSDRSKINTAYWMNTKTGRHLRFVCHEWNRNAGLTLTKTTEAGARDACRRYQHYLETGIVLP